MLRAEGPAERGAPWRNPELLGRRVPWLPRPETEQRLLDRARESVLRISGPLGCGKTRLVHEVLKGQGIAHLSLRAQPPRQGPPLAWQLARDLLAPTLAARPGAPQFASDADRQRAAQRWQEDRDTRAAPTLAGLLNQAAKATGQSIVVVCDDAEKLDGEDLALVTDLVDLAGESVRLWLVGRPGTPPAPPFEASSQIWVGALEPEEHQRFAAELTRGWSIPSEVLESWCRVTAGHPFALEEGLVALARAQRMRRSWGTFSYAGETGEEAPAYRPSSRLVAHLQAEVARLALAPQLFALAVAETAVPAQEIGEALGLAAGSSSDWGQVAAHSGLARRVPGAWGLGLEIGCAAYGRALEFGLTAETVQKLRHRLGAQLAASVGDGGSAWQTYRLLKGTPQAVQSLLQSVRGAGEPTDAELLAALVEELAALATRGMDRETELLLLWRLFQTARRLGRVHEFGPELERALELVRDEPERYLALVNLKAESEQEAGHYR
ncbi:MAG: AAA family ATPase, partial [Thermoanaerobaculia bacterium]